MAPLCADKSLRVRMENGLTIKLSVLREKLLKTLCLEGFCFHKTQIFAQSYPKNFRFETLNKKLNTSLIHQYLLLKRGTGTASSTYQLMNFSQIQPFQRRIEGTLTFKLMVWDLIMTLFSLFSPVASSMTLIIGHKPTTLRR